LYSGAPYALRVYESSNPASTVVSELTEDMTRKGFEAIQDPASPPEVHGFIHSSGFHSLAVVTEADGRSTVSIADLGSSAPTR
jgi:hypothetical protein